MLLLGGLVGGCVHYAAKPLSPEQSASALENRTLDDPGLRAFLEKNLHRDPADWPPRFWDFEMLALSAFYYHPDMEVARAEWDVARAGILTAGGRPNPSATLTPSYNFDHINAGPGLTPWLPMVSFDLPLETAGKRGDRIRQANALSESARLNIVSTAWRVRGEVRSSLLAFIADGKREALLQPQIAIQEQILTLLDQQVQAGAAARSDMALFRIALQKARIELAEARRQRAEDRAALAESIGIPVRALDGVEFATNWLNTADEATAANLTSAQLRHQAMLGRADVLAGLSDYAAAEADLQLEIAGQYPDVHLGQGYEYDQGDNIWSLSLTLDIPVLNKNQGPIAEANARRTEAAARFKALQAKVLADIDTAVESFHATEGSVAMLRSLLDEQAKSRDAIEAQLKAGALAPLDLLDAQLDFATAQAEQFDAQVKLQQSLAALEDALQRPISTMGPAVVEGGLSANKEEKP
ncbi:MAG: TolC family protein [Verrucomicrobiota bacterium]|jgi:outer membrane protein TolC